MSICPSLKSDNREVLFVSNVTRCTFGRAQSRWIAEDYNVLDSRVHEIISIFGVVPSIDVFANASNQRFPRWWGPGSGEAEDAFTRDWGGEPLLWMNPPYYQIGRAIKKVREDRAHALMVLPEWKTRKWYREARELRLLDIRYPKGVHFFERPGARKRPTPWPVRVMYLCGHGHPCDPTQVCKVTDPRVSVQGGEKNPPKSANIHIHIPIPLHIHMRTFPGGYPKASSRERGNAYPQVA